MAFDSSLKRAIRATGLSYEKTAAKLGISRNTLERVANLRQATTPATLEKIRTALGEDATTDVRVLDRSATRDATGRFSGSAAQ